MAADAESFSAALARAEEHRSAQRHDKEIEALTEAAALEPANPRPHFSLCMAHTASDNPEAACRAALRAIELAPAQHLGVLDEEARNAGVRPPRGVYPQIGLRAAVMAFDLLIRPACDAVARPSWWSDQELLRMTERAMADTPSNTRLDAAPTRSPATTASIDVTA